MAKSFPEIRLDDSFPAGIRNDLMIVAKDVVSVVSKMFQAAPPLGWRPITCRFHGKEPQVDVHPDFPHYSVALKSADRNFAPFADQLGEQLGHIFMDPRRSNGFVATLATAVSLRLFDLLSNRWQDSAVSAWAAYLPQLSCYRTERETSFLKAFPTEVRDAVAANRWLDVTRYLRFRRSDRADDPTDRALNYLGARQVLARGVGWQSLVGIASLTTPRPTGEYDWSDSLPTDFDATKGNVRSLASFLGYRTRTPFAIAAFVQKPPSDWGFAFFDGVAWRLVVEADFHSRDATEARLAQLDARNISWNRPTDG